MLNYTESQKEQVRISGISEDALSVYWTLFPENTFETAVGGLVMLLKGQGQKRWARFSDEPVEPSDDFKSAFRAEE
jgi:hypothetical protein